MKEIKIKRLHEGAIIPARATEGSAGFDIYTCIDGPVTVEPQGSFVFPTGIAVALPDPNCAALIYARSGLSVKHGLIPKNCVGVIDSDYRGEILVCLHNLSDKAYTVNPGDRIAQMVITPVLLPELVEVDELDNTARSGGGFGSSGK